MDSRRNSSSRARRSSVDNEEVEAFDMSEMTERQIRQARRAQRSSSIQGGSSSRSTMQREEVDQGKRVVEAEEEHHEEAPFEEAVSEEEELKFDGTRYPHKETMQELGICGDVEYLMELANLATYMSCQCGGYKEESCQLLATLKVRDVEYTFDIRHLDTIFGFPSGEGICQDYDQEELKSLWKTIAGPKPFSPTKSKSSSIGNPVIRYLHQCIANILFPKKATGFVSEKELCMIEQSLVFILRETKDGRKMAGDRADTSLSVVLLDHLLSYKEYAATIHRSGIRGSLCVSGLLTPILGTVGMEFGTPNVLPKFIDLDYLKGKDFLEKITPADRYLFKFNHTEL
ncbi:putative transposon protein [Arabidopsis thaliana]|uniref:Putative transposon protein n=1 Tax=Arabidopsis thaliana TaxID=3702 RepID=Q9XH19_ARATH|nr:T3E15.25 gene product [Arabidopsis thaliana]CAB81126.1 putative transposon protein [Arabidopsis thaliana]